MISAASLGRTGDSAPTQQLDAAPGNWAPGAAAHAMPTFLFGMERSGTTLLSMMIGAHPLMAVPLATAGMWTDFDRRLAQDFNNLATAYDVLRLVDAVLAHERIRLWDAALDRDALLAALPPGDYGAVVARFHAAYAEAKRKPCWANVDIATLDHMDLVNSWFRNARFLHIIRDGRDVALSHQTMPYGAGNIAECARAWVNRTTTNAKMGRILGAARYMTVRFEDLILDTRPTLERICAFLDLPYDSRMLRYGDMVAEKIPDSRRWLWPAISRPPQRSKVGQWRRRMTGSQRIVFERVAGRTLKDWGYETYERIPRTAAAYALELLYHLDEGGRSRRLRRRLGFRRRSLLERQAVRAGKENP